VPSEFIIEGLKELGALGNNYLGARELMRDLLLRASNKFAGRASRASKKKYLSGGSEDVLSVRTGRLRSSITPGVRQDGEDIIISLGTGVPYGPIHEYGGAILRGGKVVGQMPERSFLRRALEDTIEPFKEDIFTLMLGAARGGFKRG
jgi:phage gpG-like protein